MTIDTANKLEKVRVGHFPGVISKRIRKLYQERREENDLGGLRHLQPRQLINKLIIQYGLIHGRDDVLVGDRILDHWGSIEGGVTLVTEPYMYSSVWTAAETFAEAAGLDMEFIDNSTWNPKQPDDENHRHCSRICFRIKEEDK